MKLRIKKFTVMTAIGILKVMRILITLNFCNNSDNFVCRLSFVSRAGAEIAQSV
jgi:hypothetical protein